MNRPVSSFKYDVQNSDATIRAAPVNKLRFPKHIEKDFEDDYYVKNIGTALKALVLGSFIYAGFSFLDVYAAPESFSKVFLIRMGIGLPPLVIGSLIIYFRIWPTLMQPIICLATCFAGIAIVLMIMTAQPYELAYSQYYTGLILVIIFSSVLLRFWYALVANNIIILFYELVAILSQQLWSFSDGQLLFIINNFFLVGSNIIALFASYFLEISKRNDFLQRRTIEYEKNRSNVLVNELKVKNSEIRTHQSEIEAVKLKNIQAEFEKKISGIKLKSLRAQMNPHFIFNCMNTIEAFILENRPDEATKFLQKFSKLIRASLENSQHETILFEKEIDALKTYIELEKLRSKHTFTCEFEIDPALLKHKYLVPPLLIQPYVENAILHGLRHKQNGKGILRLILAIHEEQLLCIIEDNGIGRKRAAELPNARLLKHQSLGMKFAGERLSILSNTFSSSYRITIFDVENEVHSGTKVELCFPLIESSMFA